MKVEESSKQCMQRQIKIRHDHTVSAWKTVCVRLKVAGTQPRDLPTKLKSPPKPKPGVEDNLDNDEEEVSGEDDLE